MSNPRIFGTLTSAFWTNVLFTGSCVLFLALKTDWVAAQFAGIDPYWIFAAAVALGIFAVDVALLAFWQNRPRALVMAVIVADYGYVLGAVTAALVFSAALSAAAIAMLMTTALGIFLIATWQWKAVQPTAV